jgi:DNA-binding MarR family transcriptional regulator
MIEISTSVRRRRLDLDAVNSIIGYKLRRAQLNVFQQFNRRFAEFELAPADFSALSVIAGNPGRKQTEIAHALGIKRANFVALINRLDARGLTERKLVSGDRRSHALYLTEKGAALMLAVNAVQAEFESRWIDALGGEAARDRLLDLLDRIIEA